MKQANRVPTARKLLDARPVLMRYREMFNPFLTSRFFEACESMDEAALVGNEEAISLNGHLMVLAYVHQVNRLADDMPLFNNAKICSMGLTWLDPVHVDTPISEFCRSIASIEKTVGLAAEMVRAFERLLLQTKHRPDDPFYRYFVCHEWRGGDFGQYMNHVLRQYPNNRVLSEWIPKYVELVGMLVDILALMAREVARVNLAQTMDWLVECGQDEKDGDDHDKTGDERQIDETQESVQEESRADQSGLVQGKSSKAECEEQKIQ